MYCLSCNFAYQNLSKRLNQFLIINVNIMMITIEVMHASMMIEFTKWIDEIYKNDMTMWYSKQAQNVYILW